MQVSDTNLSKTLKANNYFITKPRIEIFNLLKHSPALTTKQICQKLSGVVDQASIYRNLELFENLGIVQKLYLGWSYKIELTENYSSHHHHITCINCAKIINFTDTELIEKEIARLSKKYNVRLLSHQIELSCICLNH